ncbi:MAG: formate--phosphoribosylaminoimidazolecarboxamide ligase family protein [Thermoplasmatota archaeon]
MLSRDAVLRRLQAYPPGQLTLGVIGSHSALDVCDGAADEGLRTVVIAQQGRHETYAKYFRSRRDADGQLVSGCVDETWVLPQFRDVLQPSTQDKLRTIGTIWVPNRSFTSYCAMGDIEDRFEVPMFGSRSMLRCEERSESRNYYWLLEQAGLPFPPTIARPEDIDRLAIVKLHHAKKKLERGFFTAASFDEYQTKSERLLSQGVITRENLEKARIEQYIVGPVFNFNFFHSVLDDERPLELLGVDYRFESSLDGHVRLPAPQQLTLNESQAIPEMNVVGHATATIRESLLEDVFQLAEKFVKAAKRHYAPGIIGPFCLQTCVDKDLKFYIYDVAPRIGGGTNVHVAAGHPYGNALWRKPTSTGRRIAMEIRRAAREERLAEVVT